MRGSGFWAYRLLPGCKGLVGALLAILAVPMPTLAAARTAEPVARSSEAMRLGAIGSRLISANFARCSEAETAGGTCGGRFIAVADRTINASADGRNVMVTARMLRFAGDDDALAFIVAHEMAHNILGHANRLKDIPGEFMTPENAARVRESEVEADTLAVELVVRAGFDVGAAERLLQRITKGRQRGETPATHPTFDQRIAIVTAAADDFDRASERLAHMDRPAVDVLR